GAVRPEETEDLTIADLERDVLERDAVPETLAQTLGGEGRTAPLPTCHCNSLRAHLQGHSQAWCSVRQPCLGFTAPALPWHITVREEGVSHDLARLSPCGIIVGPEVRQVARRYALLDGHVAARVA